MRERERDKERNRGGWEEEEEEERGGWRERKRERERNGGRKRYKTEKGKEESIQVRLLTVCRGRIERLRVETKRKECHAKVRGCVKNPPRKRDRKKRSIQEGC